MLPLPHHRERSLAGATSIRDCVEEKDLAGSLKFDYTILICDHNIRGSLVAHMWISFSLASNADLHFIVRSKNNRNQTPPKKVGVHSFFTITGQIHILYRVLRLLIDECPGVGKSLIPDYADA